MGEFDIERFVRLAGAVQTADLDNSEAKRCGLNDGEARILRYMADTESHTILYLRDLLAGHSAHDPEITAFLSVWVYEELWHGRALDMLLGASGRPVPKDTFTKVSAGVSIREPIEALLSHLAAHATPRFAAVHMAWGAINELTAAAAYRALERRTKNGPLKVLLQRIGKQERKHFAFYYAQAQRRLQGDWRAQALCSATLRLAWTPVGSGVSNRDTLEYVTAALFHDAAGQQALRDCDASIRNLPGLGWFNLVEKHTQRLCQNYLRTHGGIPPQPWGEPQEQAPSAPATAARKPPRSVGWTANTAAPALAES
jgi:hypothetical protein